MDKEQQIRENFLRNIQAIKEKEEKLRQKEEEIERVSKSENEPDNSLKLKKLLSERDRISKGLGVLRERFSKEPKPKARKKDGGRQ